VGQIDCGDPNIYYTGENSGSDGQTGSVLVGMSENPDRRIGGNIDHGTNEQSDHGLSENSDHGISEKSDHGISEKSDPGISE